MFTMLEFVIPLTACVSLVHAASLPAFKCDVYQCNTGDVDEFCSDERYPRCMACSDAYHLCGAEGIPNKCFGYCLEKEVQKRTLLNNETLSDNGQGNTDHHIPIIIALGIYAALVTIVIIPLALLYCKAKRHGYIGLPQKEHQKPHKHPPTSRLHLSKPKDNACILNIEDCQEPAMTMEAKLKAMPLQPRPVGQSDPHESTDITKNGFSYPPIVTPTKPYGDTGEVRGETSSSEDENETSLKERYKQPPKQEESSGADTSPPHSTESQKGPSVKNIYIQVVQQNVNGNGAATQTGDVGASNDAAEDDNDKFQTNNSNHTEDFTPYPTEESSNDNETNHTLTRDSTTTVQVDATEEDPSLVDSEPGSELPPTAQSLHTQPCDTSDKGKVALIKNTVPHSDFTAMSQSN